MSERITLTGPQRRALDRLRDGRGERRWVRIHFSVGPRHVYVDVYVDGSGCLLPVRTVGVLLRHGLIRVGEPNADGDCPIRVCEAQWRGGES